MKIVNVLSMCSAQVLCGLESIDTSFSFGFGCLKNIWSLFTISSLSKSMFSLLKHIISLNVEQSNAMKAIMLFLNLSLSW